MWKFKIWPPLGLPKVESLRFGPAKSYEIYIINIFGLLNIAIQGLGRQISNVQGLVPKFQKFKIKSAKILKVRHLTCQLLKVQGLGCQIL